MHGIDRGDDVIEAVSLLGDGDANPECRGTAGARRAARAGRHYPSSRRPRTVARWSPTAPAVQSHHDVATLQSSARRRTVGSHVGDEDPQSRGRPRPLASTGVISWPSSRFCPMYVAVGPELPIDERRRVAGDREPEPLSLPPLWDRMKALIPTSARQRSPGHHPSFPG